MADDDFVERASAGGSSLSSSYHDEVLDDVMSIISPTEMLKIGLDLVGFTERRIEQAYIVTNGDRFVSFFGASAAVCAQIWEDLQVTGIEEAFILPNDGDVKYFLMALHHLKKYPTEVEREALFDVSAMWGREKIWFFVEKIQALKAQKIVWPEEWDNEWAVTVDGQHCWVHEQLHATWSQDPKYYSHKYGKAGLNYELAISLSNNQLVWMNGPYPAGWNDLMVFKNHGLKNKLIECGVRGIGDAGYHGHHEAISAPNPHDSKAVKLFKSRALKRHETFNGLMKRFDCLNGRFRHSIKRFKCCFEAVGVICQYQIEIDHPLFDIIVDGMFED